MSTKQRHTLSQKLEIISVSYEIGLLRTEKLYDVTKKTILSWRKKYQLAGSAGLVKNNRVEHKNSRISDSQKKAITELCNSQPKISGREIIERLKLDCSIKTVLKIRNKIISDKSTEIITNIWIFNYLKLPCSVNTKPVYLLTATEKKSDITLFCITEENIPAYLNAFVEHILLFLHSVGENTTISIETNSSRFCVIFNLPESKSIPNSNIVYRKSPMLIPDYLRKKINSIPAEFSSHAKLLQYFEDIFFVFNVDQIRQNQHCNNSKLLLHQPSAITINSSKTTGSNKKMEQITDKIVTLIKSEIAKFSLKEAKSLLNYLIKISSFEHKSLELQIEIQNLSAETQIYSYDYKKSLYHYTQSLKMSKSSGNSQLIIKSQIALANYYLQTSQYRKCEKALHLAHQQCRDNGIKHSEGEILYKLGQLYKIISDNRASAITEQLLEIALKDDNKELFCKAMNLMTTIYFADGFYKKGLSCAFKSLNLASKYNFQQSIFEANYNIAEYGLRTDKYSLAEKHLLLNVKSDLNFDNYNQNDVKNQIRLGLIRCRQNQMKNGVQLIEKCLSLSQKRGDCYSESLSYRNLALVYMHTHDYKKAIFYCNKAVKINEQLGSIEQQIATFSGLAYCYGNINQTKKSLFYANKKLEAVKYTKNRVHTASAYEPMALAAVNNQEYDTAIKYFQLQLKILKPTDADMHKFYALANIGTILLHKKDYKQAQSYFKKTEKKLIKLDRNQDLALIYLDMAKIAKATGKVNKLKKYVRLAKEKAGIAGDNGIVEKADELLKS